MSKHTKSKIIHGLHVERVKRGWWIVPGVFTNSGEVLQGSLKQIKQRLENKRLFK